MWCSGALPMYHPYDPSGAYVALFSEFPWTSIIVLGGANSVRLKLNIPQSCLWADIFGLILDLRIRFRVIVDWFKSIPRSFNVKSVLTLQNNAMKWFLNVCVAHSDALRWCMFGGNNWKSMFYLEDFEWGCWELHCQVLESVVLSLWLLGCCMMFNTNWQLIVPHYFH